MRIPTGYGTEDDEKYVVAKVGDTERWKKWKTPTRDRHFLCEGGAKATKFAWFQIYLFESIYTATM